MTTDEHAAVLSDFYLDVIAARYTRNVIYPGASRAVYDNHAQVQADMLALLAELRQARAEREALRRVIDEVADYLLDKPATSGEVYAGNTLRQAARRAAPEPNAAAKETP